MEKKIDIFADKDSISLSNMEEYSICLNNIDKKYYNSIINSVCDLFIIKNNFFSVNNNTEYQLLNIALSQENKKIFPYIPPITINTISLPNSFLEDLKIRLQKESDETFQNIEKILRNDNSNINILIFIFINHILRKMDPNYMFYLLEKYFKSDDNYNLLGYKSSYTLLNDIYLSIYKNINEIENITKCERANSQLKNNIPSIFIHKDTLSIPEKNYYIMICNIFSNNMPRNLYINDIAQNQHFSSFYSYE